MCIYTGVYTSVRENNQPSPFDIIAFHEMEARRLEHFRRKKYNPSNLTAPEKWCLENDPSFLFGVFFAFFQGQTCCSFSGREPPVDSWKVSRWQLPTVKRISRPKNFTTFLRRGVFFFGFPFRLWKRHIIKSKKGVTSSTKLWGQKFAKKSSLLTTVDG